MNTQQADIFTKIAEREARCVVDTMRKVVAWVVVRGDGTRCHRSRLYCYARAKRLVARARRFGIDVYASRFGHVHVTSAQLENMR